MNIDKKVCPYCKKGPLVLRIRRPMWCKVFFFFSPYRRYKCFACGRKPYA